MPRLARQSASEGDATEWINLRRVNGSAAKHRLRQVREWLLLNRGTDIGCEGDFGGLRFVRAAESTGLRYAGEGDALRELQDGAGVAGANDPCSDGRAVRGAGDGIAVAGAGGFLGGLVRALQDVGAGIGKSGGAHGGAGGDRESEHAVARGNGAEI